MTNNSDTTILFVDDEESILDVARTFFKTRGYNVLTAANGRDAVELIENHRIDCCFTDINMPEMDGLALAEYIRNHDNTLPVVVMTGYPSLDNTIHTLKNGVVDFLVKPVNLSQMELCVQRVMRERKLFIDNIILSKEAAGKAKLEQVNKELLGKIEEMNIVNRILTDFAALRESNDVFRQLVDMAVDILKADAACFYLLNDSTETAPLTIATAGPQASAIPVPQVATEGQGDGAGVKIQTLLRETLRDERPLLIANNTNGFRRLPDPILSYMLVPFQIRSKTLGLFSAALCQGSRRFTEKDLYYLAFMSKKAEASVENLALYENIYNNLLATLYGFVKAIEARDPYTKQHSSRVTRLSITMAKAMGCSAEEQEILHVAGLLHDIGKIGIRDDILLKPGRLNDEEYRIIQQHPTIGSDIMDHLGLWSRERQIVRWHHERYDGKGYPDGLAGEEIPKLARVLSVADVFDAVASDRAYRQRMEEHQILDIMYSGAGTQFDPDIMKTFQKLYQAGKITAALTEPE